MTKVRSALSYENALTRIASLVGWKRCSEIVGQAASTVRNWSDEDTQAGIRLHAAEALDLAYRDAGGAGFPMFQCYATRLDTAAADRLASSEALVRKIATAAKENGEATAAALAATLPGANDVDREVAIRELEQSAAATSDTLASLRAGRRAEVHPGEGING